MFGRFRQQRSLLQKELGFMNTHSCSNRREFIGKTITATAFAATTISSKALAQGTAAPNSRINLGVIGVGPRCRYVLQPILKFKDVACVAIADVQASRRDAGKKMVDETYGNADVKLYRIFVSYLIAKTSTQS